MIGALQVVLEGSATAIFIRRPLAGSRSWPDTTTIDGETFPLRRLVVIIKFLDVLC